MRQKLCRRLEELEKIGAAAAAQREWLISRASAELALEKIRTLLRLNNFQQEPKESLAETFARFLGINSRELQQRLMQPAYAINPFTWEGFDEWSVAGAKSRLSRISFGPGIRTFTDSAWRWPIGRRNCESSKGSRDKKSRRG
jgi:hypothetical protein